MASFSEVFLFFCEGPHDSAFLSLLLRKALGVDRQNLVVSDLPYPFSNIIKKSMESRAAEDLRLDLAKKFFLPDFVHARGEKLILIFNSGGKNRRVESMLPFLESIFDLLSVGSTFGGGEGGRTVPSVRCSIFVDADSDGTSVALSEISRDFALICEQDWVSQAWQDSDGGRFYTQSTAFGEVSAHIWRKWEEDGGTLEDILIECFEGSGTVQSTQECLDRRFSWEPSEPQNPKNVSATAAKRLKATLCIEGQRKKPGGSLSVVLDQAGLLTEESMARSRSIAACLRHLKSWMGVP
ncbi:hypothetical protein [Pseudomonas aeruginosa]|uniref:hypothetical protein n=1 Tax=Pseudomonas aeruginosa TaxID=287 RepID=UPI0023584A74|nr:hypothetical protein [Pseudomonas aeruginosa]